MIHNQITKSVTLTKTLHYASSSNQLHFLLTKYYSFYGWIQFISRLFLQLQNKLCSYVTKVNCAFISPIALCSDSYFYYNSRIPVFSIFSYKISTVFLYPSRNEKHKFLLQLSIFLYENIKFIASYVRISCLTYDIKYYIIRQASVQVERRTSTKDKQCKL